MAILSLAMRLVSGWCDFRLIGSFLETGRLILGPGPGSCPAARSGQGAGGIPDRDPSAFHNQPVLAEKPDGQRQAAVLLGQDPFCQ